MWRGAVVGTCSGRPRALRSVETVRAVGVLSDDLACERPPFITQKWW